MNQINKEIVNTAETQALAFSIVEFIESPQDLLHHLQWDLDEYNQAESDEEKLQASVDIALVALRLVNSLTTNKDGQTIVLNKTAKEVQRAKQALNLWNERRGNGESFGELQARSLCSCEDCLFSKVNPQCTCCTSRHSGEEITNTK